MAKWRVAKSLLHLREQVNDAFPDRSKESDGTIGDANHSARTSDHNPDDDGVVKAMDITHDPENGVDSYKMAEQLRQSRDPRIKYIISNGRICSATTSPWQWRRYTGSNKHDHHVHLSVRAERKYFDDERDWDLPMLTAGKPVALLDDEREGGELCGPPTEDNLSARTVIKSLPKSLVRSKISWVQAILAFFGLGTVGSQVDRSAFDTFVAFITSPGFMLLVMLTCIGLTVYWRWRDHGRGSLQ